MILRGDDIAVSLGGRRIVEGASVVFEPGRITGLLGPNGAGKSSLLRAACGLVPLAAGRVTVGSADLCTMPRAAIGRTIAFLPQERTVHWPLAAEAVVRLGRLPHRGTAQGTPHQDDRSVNAAMHATDITHLARRSCGSLSGGELARVLVARALAQETAIILADEPTSGLDPAHALGLFEVLHGLATEGRTIVVALHDLSLAARFCHDVVMMKAGRVAASGPCAAMLVAERLDPLFGARMAVGAVAGVPAIVPIAPGK
jgi:iron complex transport system ATP-binding protein